MDRKNRTPSVAKNQSALKIVWFALLLAMFAYTAVVFVFSSPEAPGVRENVKTAFLLGGAALGIISLLIYRFSLSDKSLRKKFLATEGQEQEKRLEELSNRLLLPHVVPWGINESVVLLGFVLSFLSKDPMDAIPFSVIGTVLHIYMYPRVEQIVESTKNYV
ncbi:MAG: hypothetical protein F4Y78_02320 [Candidatus Dadabacteria bacterium]|nr:hypothetical protein [Candidatus Dadabacteria bacterium]MYA48889.1 hypothetical protein [Candidatus Dadabacteria bacterium]MYF47966.1 hypothetical protein [Candidatus Dadabacteria bacterium]MYG82423.1 hypothetical protein [Candidatus Dadabacteria bacterium]MYK49376.1 hypothetical protein [Candidatus Dadabacteria bacterium]